MGNQPTTGEVIRAKVHAVGGSRPRCQKGKACSAACIDPNETCLVEFPTPVSSSLSKAKNEIGQSTPDLDKAISEMGTVRENYLDSVDYFMRKGIGEPDSKRPWEKKSSYEKGREMAKEFNKMLEDKGLQGKVEPLKVPVKWEIYQAVKERYDKIEKSLIERLKAASDKGDKMEYDRVARRLKLIEGKIGKKLGKGSLPTLDWYWKPKEVTPPLSSLKTASQFEAREKKTAGMTRALTKDATEVTKLLGYGGNDGYDLYKSDKEADKYEGVRDKARFNISDSIAAMQAYTVSSETAREIRLAQRDKNNSTEEYRRYARDLENLLRWNELPTPRVEKYRGFRASPEHLQRMIEESSAKEKFKHNTIYSWSSSLGVGRSFADSELKDLPERTEKVIFRAINKRGVPIELITSVTDEFELLTHGGVNYRHLGYRPLKVGDETYHVFDVEEY